MELPTALIPLVLLPKGTYHGIVRTVHDGDTLQLLLFVAVKGRLEGIQAPELRGPESDKALKARDLLASLVKDKVVEIKIGDDYKYGGEKMVSVHADGKDVAQALIDAGLAVAWNGQGPRPLGAVFGDK